MSMEQPTRNVRIIALRRFALAITILNVLGHTVLGFEQAYAQPIASLLTAYTLELVLEYVEACNKHRRPAFLCGGVAGLVDFLLPAHITGLAVGMLLYASDRILPFVFASSIAICSKAIFRIDSGRGSRHFFNPSNFGITATLLLFPFVGISPPYMFTEGLPAAGAILLPLIITASGSFLNIKLTRRLPLILSWLAGFVVQAAIRGLISGQFFSIANAMTGVAFLLFTFYMVTDPGTTPATTRGQVVFGFSVALLYGGLVLLHVVFGMFFALTLVCSGRGVVLAYERLRERARAQLPTRLEQPELATRASERLYPA